MLYVTRMTQKNDSINSIPQHGRVVEKILGKNKNNNFIIFIRSISR